jgi:ribulose-bisphosphate carboxylase large chain
MAARLEADYLIETATDPTRAAAIMAGEQSSGTFVALPHETPELLERAAARVERLQEIDPQPGPSLPGAAPDQGKGWRRALVTLSWPVDNLGPSLPNVISTVAGNLYELRPFSGLRVLDIRLPEAFATANPGPRFGIDGTRALADVAHGPLIGTIIKPSVGLTPEGTAELLGLLAGAGIDFVKDDELQADGPACPFDARARAVMDVINTHAQRTGKKVMYAFNLTGEVDEMRRRHDLIRDLGGTCVMVNLNSVGMTGFLALSRHSQLPIHAHRCGWGYLSRHPALGWSYAAWSKLWRVAGADHMHVNGLANKFCEDDDSVLASARAQVTPVWSDKPCIAMPVFSSGQTVLQAAPTWQGLGSADLIHAVGGGIMGHPDGPEAGVRALRAAWDAAIAGDDIDTRSAAEPALARAVAQARGQ